MRFVLTLLLLVSGLFAQQRISRPRPRAAAVQKPIRTHFVLWETKQHLRQRTGAPHQYYVPAIDKLIRPDEYSYYQISYKKVYDVFYRDTPLGIVRVLVAYVNDDSRSHLDPEVRVGHVYFIFDKDVQLRDALTAIFEAQEVCAEGCNMNGFAASVVAQPRSPSEEQLQLARRMRPQWHGDPMPDATPGLHIFYQDSPYAVDFEHGYVERIDFSLVSNASQERYSIEIRGKPPTMLDLWRPRRHPSESAAATVAEGKNQSTNKASSSRRP
jgi:hypothetical protein